MLFGRSDEFAAARDVLDRARGGRGGVLVLSGEPGIGKSALASALADAAAASGARVAFGRAWEVGGAPAYWPWSQALADLDLDLDDLLGSAAGDMAAANRLVAFDRVARRLYALAKEQPIVVVLDDVHAADTASLELAVVVARGIARHRLVLVATTRESELHDSPLHDELVAKLAREGQRLALRRLDEHAIAEWLAAEHFAGSATDVLRLTEGNPLFVVEAVRVGVDRFARAAAGGAAVILREHLARATPKARDLLAVAAVLGREASLREVATLADAPPDDVAAAVREGVRVGILSAAGDDCLVFAHVLLRDALYEALPPSRRAELHARAARARALRDADAMLAAHHLIAADTVVDAREIVGGVVRAAALAIKRHAHAGAVALVERARAALAARLDAAAELALDLVAAEAHMGADPATGRRLAQACAERAIRLGDATALARAALIYGFELISGERDETMVRLLEEALAVVPSEERALRARLVARLSSAMVPVRSDSEMEVARARAAEGIAIARTLGDPQTLLFALRYGSAALGYAVSIEARRALIEELIPLARTLHDDLTLVNAGGLYVAHLFESGQPDAARAEADRYLRYLDGLDIPQARWRAVATRASLAALDARYDDARALSGALHVASQEAAARPGMIAWALLQLSVCVCDGNTAALREHDAELSALLASKGPMGPWLALLHALLGRTDEARQALMPVLALPRGFPWLVTAGQVALLLQDRDLAIRFYPLLQREALRSRFFWGPAAVFPLGPTSRILGELAWLCGDSALAREHLDEAIEHCRGCSAASLLELSLRARARLDEGERNATSVRTPQQRRDVTLAREGDVWLVTSAGTPPFRVKHAKGFDYLSALLAQPRRELYVLALAGAGEAAEDAGAILDPRAKDAYRRRVEDLEDQIAEAERNGDVGRAEKAHDEMDRIAAELASAVGLGNRDRKAASNVERARINVQRRIKDAVRRIAEQDAELGQYLEATVKTGAYCVYEPL